MNWNTELYKYGNIIGKNSSKGEVFAIDYNIVCRVLLLIKDFVDNNIDAVAVLQEIPIDCNVTKTKHEIFRMIEQLFDESKYSILYNRNTSVRHNIKVTMVIAKKDFVKMDLYGINTNIADFCNCYLSFSCSGKRILAVHQNFSPGGQIICKVNFKNYMPDIIIGDFNIGDYNKPFEKESEQKDFNSRRNAYNSILSKGYIDLCDGKWTTQYKTSIDHVLLAEQWKSEKTENAFIDTKIKISDHYPIYVNIED